MFIGNHETYKSLLLAIKEHLECTTPNPTLFNQWSANTRLDIRAIHSRYLGFVGTAYSQHDDLSAQLLNGSVENFDDEDSREYLKLIEDDAGIGVSVSASGESDFYAVLNLATLNYINKSIHLEDLKNDRTK